MVVEDTAETTEEATKIIEAEVDTIQTETETDSVRDLQEAQTTHQQWTGVLMTPCGTNKLKRKKILLESHLDKDHLNSSVKRHLSLNKTFALKVIQIRTLQLTRAAKFCCTKQSWLLNL